MVEESRYQGRAANDVETHLSGVKLGGSSRYEGSRKSSENKSDLHLGGYVDRHCLLDRTCSDSEKWL